ncbi:hypothetical protein K1719_011542 [Acacia pycnantha]|nr:hypothetical protein K1719_045105 [Acacia pycnantha]KAI9117376.1 hypothetical protein K1719_011542 [Acacia pycnantha]
MDFEKDQKQLMKIDVLGRNSSVGCSSRIFYYYASGEGVPFNWEMKPGIAKDPPKEELPPLSPPPALVSLGLPKPCFHENPNPYYSTVWSRLRHSLWKRITRKGNNRKRLSLPECPKNDDQHVKDLDVFETFLECNSDFESFASPRDSSCSSSSFSSSSPPAMQATRSGSCSAGEAYGRPFSCIPIHFAKTLIPIMKRG